MKQKLLFIIPSLDSGGGEKSLINLLNTIDYSLYEVDLILFKKKGLFLNLVPTQVNILEISGNYIPFTKGIISSILYFLSKLNIGLIFHRKIFAIKNFLIKNKAIAEQKSWANISKSIPNLERKYDIAIAYLEKSSIYYLVDKVSASKKIGWIHTNYSTSGLNKSFDDLYFSKLDSLVTVSRECQQSLIDNFQKLKGKIKTIDNIVSSETVLALSKEKFNDKNYNPDDFTIITTARLSTEKGIDIAIEACDKCVKINPRIKWYVIGDGKERAHIQAKIQAYFLQNNFFLLGLKTNPYPYIKQAGIYVQPSRYEGKSIAIDEAKILNKPIIVTNYDSAKDQITHLQSGIISNFDPQILANDIVGLLNDKKLQQDLSFYLQQNIEDNSEKEIAEFYKIING